MLRITNLVSGVQLTSLPLTELSDVKDLKQHLNQQHGLPPRFRQRLLHEGAALDDAVKLDTAFHLKLVAATSQGTDTRKRRAAGAQRSFAGDGASKRRLEPEAVPPPRRRKRLAEENLRNFVEPDTVMDLQVVILTFSEASQDQHRKLCRAAGEGLVAEVEALLQLAIDPDAVKDEDEDGSTPLMIASEHGHMHIAQLLLEAGADTDLPDLAGGTALMRGAVRGHAPVVQLLLEAGAETDLRDHGDSTALMWAAWRGDALVVQLLIEAGARHDVRDPRGRTPLMDASMFGFALVVKLLLEAGADRHLRDYEGQTALIFAKKREVRRLLEASATT
ncbi:unnamed protein product [Symbiodinium sp. CCMP2456]|nr:unnamed protein product [Symbiodinium sp. CCMP2456]